MFCSCLVVCVCVCACVLSHSSSVMFWNSLNSDLLHIGLSVTFCISCRKQHSVSVWDTPRRLHVKLHWLGVNITELLQFHCSLCVRASVSVSIYVFLGVVTIGIYHRGIWPDNKVRGYVCVFVCLGVCVCVCVFVFLCVCVCVFVFLYVCVCCYHV